MQEEGGDQLRLFHQAAGVGAQVEHQPAGVLALQLVLDRFQHFRVRAGAELGERHHAEWTPWTLRVIEATTGWEIVARVRVTVRIFGCPPMPRPPAPVRLRGRCFHAQPHVGVGGPFDEAGRRVLRQAREAAAVDRDDQIFRLQPGARGGGGVEDLHDCSPLGFGVDLDADPLKLPGWSNSLSSLAVR